MTGDVRSSSRLMTHARLPEETSLITANGRPGQRRNFLQLLLLMSQSEFRSYFYSCYLNADNGDSVNLIRLGQAGGGDSIPSTVAKGPSFSWPQLSHRVIS
ncbi:hypothetical protein ARTHROSP310_30260 [Arthrobacter sp. AD-310]